MYLLLFCPSPGATRTMRDRCQLSDAIVPWSIVLVADWLTADTLWQGGRCWYGLMLVGPGRGRGGWRYDWLHNATCGAGNIQEPLQQSAQLNRAAQGVTTKELSWALPYHGGILSHKDLGGAVELLWKIAEQLERQRIYSTVLTRTTWYYTKISDPKGPIPKLVMETKKISPSGSQCTLEKVRCNFTKLLSPRAERNFFSTYVNIKYASLILKSLFAFVTWFYYGCTQYR